MKVFFDTNVYVAEALLGEGVVRMLDAVITARWRIYASRFVVDELGRVLVDQLGFGRRLAVLSQRRIVRRSTLVEGRTSSAEVPGDPDDSPILRAALESGADFLVTNDRHLLALNPYEGLRIIRIADFVELLREQGLLS